MNGHSFADFYRNTTDDCSDSTRFYYNHGHNILRLFDVSPNFPFTTIETKRHY